jgi:hypothetical protein
MHVVLVAGLILTPLHGMALLIAGSAKADSSVIMTRGAAWRAWYRLDRIQRLYWRLGFVAGIVCPFIT